MPEMLTIGLELAGCNPLGQFQQQASGNQRLQPACPREAAGSLTKGPCVECWEHCQAGQGQAQQELRLHRVGLVGLGAGKQQAGSKSRQGASRELERCKGANWGADEAAEPLEGPQVARP